MGDESETVETWRKTSIVMRCPSCGNANRMLVGLASEPQEKV